MRETFVRRLLLVSGFVLVLVAAGTAGFLQFPGWTLSDALYMTWITLTAVGYEEVRPLSDTGRLLASGLLAGGITSMGLYWALITSLIVELDLGDVLRRRQMTKKLEQMEDHVIVCGVGRTGRQVVRELAGGDRPFVVVEHDEARAEVIRESLDDEPAVIVDDATHDETLERARIDRACGLIAALSRDEDNLYVTLSARALNPDLNIVARAQEEETMNKLYRAGADHVVSPNITGGARMASAMLRPHVLSFLDVVTGGEGLALRLEEVSLPEGSTLAGVTLQDARIPQKTGLIVIAVREDGAEPGHGGLTYNPGPEVRLDAGDVLIVLGTPGQVDNLRALAGDES